MSMKKNLPFYWIYFLFLAGIIIPLPANAVRPVGDFITFSGYVRLNATYRNLTQNYTSGGAYTPKSIILNGVYPDDPLGNGLYTGYREPLFMLQMIAKPTRNTSFDIDFLIDNQLAGELSNPNSTLYPKRIQTYRFLNFTSTIENKYGFFELKAGGVLFTSMSVATLWNYEYRDDMFERYPWEWQTNSYKRYVTFYEDKNIARDSRWGSASLQGFSLSGVGLPKRFQFKIAYGKTNNVGGFQSFLNNNNSNILAIQVQKKIATHLMGMNYYISRNVINDNSLLLDYRNIAREFILSAETKWNFQKWSATAEIGTGAVSNPVDGPNQWDPLVITKFSSAKGMFPFIANAQMYYIGANVVNLNSGILNTSNRNIQADFTQVDPQYNITTFEGAVTEFGQLANNRKGINLSIAKDINDLKVVVSLSSSQEIEHIFDTITYQHRLNGINRSQFLFYRNGVGPYQRQMNTWRRSWEKIAITDSNSTSLTSFNLIDVAFKYKFVLGKKEVIVSNYTNYNSVQDQLAALAYFSNKAYLRTLYNESMVFYPAHPKVVLVGLFGIERSVGNSLTTLSEEGKPVNQTGYGYGFGVDYDINKTTGLYFRQRWYSYQDKNFVLDRFKGFETNLELKIFF